jgi:hypothetical protein
MKGLPLPSTQPQSPTDCLKHRHTDTAQETPDRPGGGNTAFDILSSNDRPIRRLSLSQLRSSTLNHLSDPDLNLYHPLQTVTTTLIDQIDHARPPHVQPRIQRQAGAGIFH